MPEPDTERFGPPAGGASISRRSSPPGSAFSSDSNISVASSVGVSRAASSPEDSSTKRSMEKAKESAVLGSPQPTPLASPIRAENRVKCSWELFHPHLASLSPDLKSVTALRDLTCCAALGRPSSQVGAVTIWQFRIDESRVNQGGAICIGLCDAEAPFTLTEAGSGTGGKSAGFNPYSGTLLQSDNCWEVFYRGAPEGQKLMRQDLQGRANGTIVHVRHNARRGGAVAFRVDGEPWVEAHGVRLRSARPWLHLFKSNDRVTLETASQSFDYTRTSSSSSRSSTCSEHGTGTAAAAAGKKESGSDMSSRPPSNTSRPGSSKVSPLLGHLVSPRPTIGRRALAARHWQDR